VPAITVAALRRYPVKSLAGESVDRLDLDGRGCVGDRRWSVRTAAGKLGSGKSTRRFEAVAGLLDLRATTCDDRTRIDFPDGSTCFADDPAVHAELSRRLGRPVTLVAETDVSHFDDGPVSLVGSGSVDAIGTHQRQQVDAARFRPNIVLRTETPFVEDAWVGRTVRIGTATLMVALRSSRCVMVDMRTADLPEQHGNLLATGDLNDACLGVIASVVTPGSVSLGDVATVDETS
jgi:uncharacterized protein YcbX